MLWKQLKVVVKLINFLLDFVLIAGFESLLTLLIVLGFNWKSLAKSKLLLAWLAITICIRTVPIITFGIPIITQSITATFSAFILFKLFNFNFKKCIINCFIMAFGIMLVSELIWYVIIKNFINLNIYSTLNVFQKFIYGLGGRFIEILLIYFYRKGCVDMGYYWFLAKEENEEVEVEVEDEETEE